MRAYRLLPILLLAACGQAGDLYLPAEQPKQPAPEQAPAPTQAPAEEPADKKDAPKGSR